MSASTAGSLPSSKDLIWYVVSKLSQNSGVVPSARERSQAISTEMLVDRLGEAILRDTQGLKELLE